MRPTKERLRADRWKGGPDRSPRANAACRNCKGSIIAGFSVCCDTCFSTGREMIPLSEFFVWYRLGVP